MVGIKLTSFIPDFLKPVLRRIHMMYKRMTSPSPLTRGKLHEYWKKPWDGNNLPESYLRGEEKSKFLVEIVKKYSTSNAKILEIGCNVGRNLNYLFLNGFKNLEGIEISDEAVQLLKHTYPEMERHTKIHNAAVEEIIREFRDYEFDIVFTMAVLEHVHPDSEWIFSEIVRITNHILVTIEDEYAASWRAFPRNYKRVFTHLGMKQIEEINCGKIDGLGDSFFARIFKRR